ncbi:response regulator transcription factor [Streptomyces fagopyri]|uniref:response regulator transcription factor n=1 Tax=Streptomyces fagopyri TaxID=2662397 RepID=UPI00371F06B0
MRRGSGPVVARWSAPDTAAPAAYGDLAGHPGSGGTSPDNREEAAMDERHATLRVLPAPVPTHEEHAGRAPAPRPGAPAAVRVHVVGEDPLARRGITALLEGHPGIRVTGESEPGPELLRALAARPPHVLVAHGAFAGEQREAPALGGGDLPLLVLGGPARTDGTDRADRTDGTDRAGRPAGGHLPATTTAGQLASAVVLAAAGYTLVHAPDPAPAGRRSTGPPIPPISPVSPDRLTDRECQVLDLLARGLSNGEIAQALTLSEHTVKTHVQNLLHKLRLRNRVHAAIYAFESGLRPPAARPSA